VPLHERGLVNKFQAQHLIWYTNDDYTPSVHPTENRVCKVCDLPFRTIMDTTATEQNDLASSQRNLAYRKKIFISALVVSFLALLVFLPALQNDFVYWDDDEFILENHHIRSIDSHLIAWSFTNPHTQWTPLRWFSHAVDMQLWGLNPFGHHLTSVVLHMVNVVLVMLCSVKILEIVWSKEPSHTSEEQATRRWKTIIAAIAAIDADVVGLIEIENQWAQQLLAPINSVAAAIAIGALGIRKFYRRIFR